MSNFSLTPDLAAQIAQRDPVLSQNTEQGFTNTYGPGTNIPDGQLGFAVPALGVSALGLYLLYQKHQQDKKDREQEKVALTWQDVRAQLPGFHAPDILLGGAAGAGAGMLYDYIRGGEKGKRFNQALRRILTGAAVGAGITNLVGDRARRYITNSAVLAGYDGGDMLGQLKPRSWQHFWDAAIKDKPSYNPEKVREFVSKFKNTEVGQRVLDARREINRIGMGVDLHNPETSVWQRNDGDKGAPYYSLNEKNKDYLRNLLSIYLPAESNPNQLMIGGTGALLFQNPNKGFKFLNRGVPKYNQDPMDTQRLTDFFGTNPLLGAQQLIAQQNGNDVDLLSMDRHDVTPSDETIKNLFGSVFSGKVFSPEWRGQVAPGGYEQGQTNAQALTGAAGRMLWDRVLRHENPWVAQKFKFSPVTTPVGPEYGLNMLRQDNTPVFSRPMNRGDVFEYLQQLQGGDTIPEIK
jgi:hypothetical protein